MKRSTRPCRTVSSRRKGSPTGWTCTGRGCSSAERRASGAAAEAPGRLPCPRRACHSFRRSAPTIHTSPAEPSLGFSTLVPGAGQAFAGAWRRALVLFALFALGAVPVPRGRRCAHPDGGVAPGGRAPPGSGCGQHLPLALRLFATLDAFRMGGLAKSVPALVAAGAIAAATAIPHVAAGYVTVRSEVTLQRVFADEEPSDVLPAILIPADGRSRGARCCPPRPAPSRRRFRPGGFPRPETFSFRRTRRSRGGG